MHVIGNLLRPIIYVSVANVDRDAQVSFANAMYIAGIITSVISPTRTSAARTALFCDDSLTAYDGPLVVNQRP